jgi:PAS domain S-box-containing protein
MFRLFLCITTQHNLWLVGAAAFVCLAATFATFFLYSRVTLFPLSRRCAWLAMTGLVSGSGIWTTHFVAMLAFKTGLPTGYEALGTIGSLAVAIVSTTLGFAIGSAKLEGTRPGLFAILGGLIVGLGITFMHYVGMSGYRTAGVLQWNMDFVAASVVIGAVFASAALFVARPRAGLLLQVAGGGLLSLAIVGMHFTGMSAVTILPDSGIAVPASLMSDGVMIIAAIAVTALILVTAIGGAAFDTASRNGNLRRLREALDVMPEGLAFYDADDRLVAWNAKYEDLCRVSGSSLCAGMAFSDLLETTLVHGAYPDSAGREKEWLSEREAAHRSGVLSVTQKTVDGRWLRITERRTADGGIVSVNVDITDLKCAEEAMAQARDRAEEHSRRADAAEASAGLGHWRMDLQTREVTWSAQMYRNYGLADNASIDPDAVLAMVHPDDAIVSAARLKRHFAGEPAENSITRIVRADGALRYLASNSSIERGPDGGARAVIGTVMDVTSQKLAEIAIAKSEERFRRLAVNAPDMITECSLDGIMTYVSPACLAITGFTQEELTGRSFASLMEPEDGKKIQEMCRAVFESKGKFASWPMEFRARTKSGNELWLECKPTFAVDPVTGRFSGLTDVVRDISPRKALESDLRHARAEAETASAVKAEFLANMSHELRTPLTSIIGFTGLATRQPELSDLTRDYIDRVFNASSALLCTVNDILDFSKLEAGKVSIHPEPVSLAKLGRDTLNLFSAQAGAKDLTLAYEGVGDVLVLAIDPNRVRQILLNLVSNAVKFTAAGNVTLRTRYDDATGMLHIAVVDTGEGISRDKQERLFKRFSQIDGSLTRTQSGTGLGLAICKGLAEAMGGEIGIESEPGKGSSFWFRIPAQKLGIPASGFGHKPVKHLSLAGVRTLVVDDNSLNRELARLFLLGAGAEVREACDGEEAVELASQWPFDVILMDMRMPKLDGLGALQRIRAEGGPNDATPILAFTAGADALIATGSGDIGFQALVEKPFTATTILAAVAKATAFEHETQSLELADAG